MVFRSSVVRRVLLPLALFGSAAACASAEDGVSKGASALVEAPEVCLSKKGVTIDPLLSLAVTDPVVLARFPFERVMNQLVALGGEPGQTALSLYQQWWDTQNLGKDDLHCNGSINGFPVQCPRPEGSLATTNPFVDGPNTPNAIRPVALFNRFDLAPQNGAHCGEYRMIFARKGPSGGRLLVIFEGALTNPNPRGGLASCRPMAEAWASLSTMRDPAARASLLEKIYFDGLSGFLPVVHPAHYGLGSASGGYGLPSGVAGQIRSNQFMGAQWQLREFQLAKTCPVIRPGDPLEKAVDPDALIRPPDVCQHLVVKPVTVKNNPFRELFDETTVQAQGPAFRAAFPSQVASLAATNVNLIAMETPDVFNGGESNSQTDEDSYGKQMRTSPVFASQIQAQLTAIGSTLTPENIAARATTQSCAGCHDLSNFTFPSPPPPALPSPRPPLGGGLTWPQSLGFVHVSEGGALSQALTQEFLPARKAVLEAFLNSARCGLVLDKDQAEAKARTEGTLPTRTLSGRTTH